MTFERNVKHCMNTRIPNALLGLLLWLVPITLPAAPGAAETPLVKTEVDWPAFLGRHDLVWEQLPLQWNEGAFVGNGQLGLMVYATTADNRVDFHLGRQDVTDSRTGHGLVILVKVRGFLEPAQAMVSELPSTCIAVADWSAFR